MPRAREPRWWLFIHQLPPKPAYLRVKIGRRLSRLGAVALKNTVYVLPCTDDTHEDLEWLLREVETGGGEAMLCEARFVDGLSDADVEKLFREARDADYDELADEVESVRTTLAAHHSSATAEAELARLVRRMDEIAVVDFFDAPGKRRAERALSALRATVSDTPSESLARSPRETYAGKIWVTRAGVQVDRIASAWLVRRFIDPDARFKFVPPRGYKPLANEVRFDMFEAEFSHEGDGCTFETLIRRFATEEPALAPIAEVIHDIDIKDGKFRRAETSGVAGLLAGIALGHKTDEQRLERGFALFDDLLAFFRNRGKA